MSISLPLDTDAPVDMLRRAPYGTAIQMIASLLAEDEDKFVIRPKTLSVLPLPHMEDGQTTLSRSVPVRPTGYVEARRSHKIVDDILSSPAVPPPTRPSLTLIDRDGSSSSGDSRLSLPRPLTRPALPPPAPKKAVGTLSDAMDLF
jgi:hypothetical protein